MKTKIFLAIVFFLALMAIFHGRVEAQTTRTWVGGYSVTLVVNTNLNNAGTFLLETINGTYSSNLTVNGTLINTGTVNVNPGTGGSRTITANINNQGTININTSLVLNKTNASYTNTGTINLAPGKTLNITGSPTFNFNAGTFSLNGPGTLSLCRREIITG